MHTQEIKLYFVSWIHNSYKVNNCYFDLSIFFFAIFTEYFKTKAKFDGKKLLQEDFFFEERFPRFIPMEQSIQDSEVQSTVAVENTKTIVKKEENRVPHNAREQKK